MYQPKVDVDKLNAVKVVVRTVEWFMRRENNRWLGWKRINQSIRIFDGR